MQTQEDWPVLLNSILFSMHCNTHSSTGYSPICMLFHKDPILPFELANRKGNTTSGHWSGNDSENDSKFNDPGEEPDDNKNDSTKGVSMNEFDEVFQMVERIEKEQKEIFATAGKQIIKAQKHQAKGYNRRHGIDTSFEVSMKVLKKNSSKSLSKLTPRFLGPYSIVSKCANGNFTSDNIDTLSQDSDMEDENDDFISCE